MEQSTRRVILVTGASSGLGKALSYEYARRGWNVALAARRFERISEISKILTKTYGIECLPIRCDVTRSPDLEDAVKTIITTFGRLDVVIANAGYAVPGIFEELSLEDYRKQFETNVFGVLRTAYAVIPELKKTRGSFCIIGSVNGMIPFAAGSSPYVMSKFALRGLSDILGLELNPYNVSVTHIMPGFMRTEFCPDGREGKPFVELLMVNPEKAAKKVYWAIWHRKKEMVVTTHGKTAVILERMFPGLRRGASRFTIKKRPSVTVSLKTYR